MSLSATAQMLGYKSKTTAHRILNDQTNYDTIERFYHAILEQEICDFSRDEKAALETALDMRRVGAEVSRANDAMWSFIQRPTEEKKEIPAVGHFLDGRHAAFPVSEVLRFYMGEKKIHAIIINSRTILPTITKCLREMPTANMVIDHYVFVNDDASRTVEYMHATLPLMCDRRYRGYSVHSEDLNDRTGGVLGGDWIIIDVEMHEGRHIRWQGAVLPGVVHALSVSTECDVFSFWQRILDAYLPVTRPVHLMEPLLSIEDYIRMVENAMKMEADRGIYRWRGDIGFDFVPIPLQRAAVVEGCVQAGMDISDAAVMEKIDRLYAIQKQRYENLTGKKKSTHCIISEDSLRRFAQTGIHSDQPFFMRAYTVAERRQILEHIRDRLKEDPYFEVHILKESVPPMMLNICCYEGDGVVFTRLEDDDSQQEMRRGELLVTQHQFVQALYDFLRKEILTRWVLPAQSTQDLLKELIKELEEQEK
ncbi:MAG: hypothetical protein E7335_01655 [Clostridiales bacterium]|nr:hypothetical protein [Clostridiales bacterium]